MAHYQKTCLHCAFPADPNAQICTRCGAAFPYTGAHPPQYGPYGAPPVPYTGKDRTAAALLAFFFGSLGVHMFYLGHTGWGIAYAAISIVTCGLGAIILHLVSIVQCILYLTSTEYDFQQKYVIEKRIF